MQLEAIRLVADWLNGVTTGSTAYSINAQLPGVPLYAGDTQPPTVTVYDSTRHPWVARRLAPEDNAVTTPAVVVMENAAPTVDGEIDQSYRDGTFHIAVIYLIDVSDSAKGNRHALYTKRAIMRSLAQLHITDAARQANSIALYVCDGITLSQSLGKWGDSWLTSGLVADYTVRDLAPNAV